MGPWVKDLSKMDTWRDIAFGSAVGATAGTGLDCVAANVGVHVKIAARPPHGSNQPSLPAV